MFKDVKNFVDDAVWGGLLGRHDIVDVQIAITTEGISVGCWSEGGLLWNDSFFVESDSGGVALVADDDDEGETLLFIEKRRWITEA